MKEIYELEVRFQMVSEQSKARQEALARLQVLTKSRSSEMNKVLRIFFLTATETNVDPIAMRYPAMEGEMI